SPDRYVVVSNEELEALDPKKTKTIDIEEFVDLEEIDPLYYDHPYFLLPGQGAAKPYKLLVTAMENAGKVAIARVVIRTKEQLVALRPLGDVLAMATMNFHDEVVDPESFDEAPGEAAARSPRADRRSLPSVTHVAPRTGASATIGGVEASTQAALPPGPKLPKLIQTLGFAVMPARFFDACRRRYGEVVTFRTLF